MIDDGRLLDHHALQGGGQMTPIYGAAGALRSVSSNSSSPGGTHHQNTPAALLVVPQPINATKIGGLTNGTGRKYQCKMCPQVMNIFIFFYFALIKS